MPVDTSKCAFTLQACPDHQCDECPKRKHALDEIKRKAVEDSKLDYWKEFTSGNPSFGE